MNKDKLRPEIIQGELWFFDDNVKGDYPKSYTLKDLLSQATLKERERIVYMIKTETGTLEDLIDRINQLK